MLTESPGLLAQTSYIEKKYQDDLKDKRRLIRRINSYESSLNCRMNACLKQMKLSSNLDKNISESLTDNEMLNDEALKPADEPESWSKKDSGETTTTNQSVTSINILPNKHALVKRRTKADLQREPYLDHEFSRSANSTPTYSIGREPSFVNPGTPHNSVVTNEPSSLANSKTFSSSTISISVKKHPAPGNLKSWGSVLGLALFRSTSGSPLSSSAGKVSETKSLIALANSCQR